MSHSPHSRAPFTSPSTIPDEGRITPLMLVDIFIDYLRQLDPRTFEKNKSSILSELRNMNFRHRVVHFALTLLYPDQFKPDDERQNPILSNCLGNAQRQEIEYYKLIDDLK